MIRFEPSDQLRNDLNDTVHNYPSNQSPFDLNKLQEEMKVSGDKIIDLIEKLLNIVKKRLTFTIPLSFWIVLRIWFDWRFHRTKRCEVMLWLERNGLQREELVSWLLVSLPRETEALQNGLVQSQWSFRCSPTDWLMLDVLLDLSFCLIMAFHSG